MEKWIEILKAGSYPQGNVSISDLNAMAKYYDPSFQQAPFISEHRKFNDKGELENNLSALGWVKAVRVRDNVLEVLPEENDQFLKMMYDGVSYKYASAEIETATIGGQNVPYLGAIAVTNFPASKIQRIKLNGQEDIRVYTKQLKFNQEEIIMNKEQFIQLCKTLGLPEDSKPETVIAKLTEMKTELGKKEEFKDTVEKFGKVISLIKVNDDDADDDDNPVNESLKKLTDTVNNVLTKFDAQDVRDAEAIFDQAVKDRKVMPSQKEDLVGTKEKPGAYYKNAAGLKTFVDKLPVLKLSATITVPKNETTGKPLTYAELVKDPVKFQQMQKDNPELLEELKSKRFEPVEAEAK